MPPDSLAVTLSCHPESPTDAVRGIAARVRREPGGTLAVSYLLDGDFERLRVPAPRAPRRAERLWRHTCCELFIAPKGAPEYYEYNLSPSGEWAIHAFDRYRSARADSLQSGGLAPEVAVRGAGRQLELDAVIRLDRLPSLDAGSALTLAISAVVEERDGGLSYWALWHPPGRPDFHHPGAFALELPAPTTPALRVER